MKKIWWKFQKTVLIILSIIQFKDLLEDRQEDEKILLKLWICDWLMFEGNFIFH